MVLAIWSEQFTSTDRVIPIHCSSANVRRSDVRTAAETVWAVLQQISGDGVAAALQTDYGPETETPLPAEAAKVLRGVAECILH